MTGLRVSAGGQAGGRPCPLYRATTALGGEAAASALRDALDGLDPAPVASEMHDHDDGSGLWDVGGLFDGGPDLAGLALLARLHGAPDFAVARVEDRDWVAQVRAELTPVEAGRFVVFGSHDRGRSRPTGSGWRSRRRRPSGPGIMRRPRGACWRSTGWRARVASPGASRTSAAGPACWRWRRRRSGRRGRSRATSTRWRRATARANVAANGLADRVACVTAAGFRHPRLRAGAPYDLVFANILAGPLQAPGAGRRRASAPGGHRDPVGDPGAAGEGRRGRLPLLGLRAPGDGADRRLDDAGVAAGALKPAQRPASVPATSGISPRCRPMSASCASESPRSTVSVRRALRQATRRL